MIGLELARRLQAAGLPWHPSERDMFVVPSSQMEEHIFVISELTALVQLYQGEPVVSFHGTSEWALDHVMVNDVVWLPSETQLRESLLEAIGPDAPLRLDRMTQGYQLTCGIQANIYTVQASTVEECYALALLRALGEQVKPQ